MRDYGDAGYAQSLNGEAGTGRGQRTILSIGSDDDEDGTSDTLSETPN